MLTLDWKPPTRKDVRGQVSWDTDTTHRPKHNRVPEAGFNNC